MAQPQRRHPLRNAAIATAVILTLTIVIVSTCRAVEEPWDGGATSIPIGGRPAGDGNSESRVREAEIVTTDNVSRNRTGDGPALQTLAMPQLRDGVPTRIPKPQTATPTRPATPPLATADLSHDGLDASEEYGRQVYRCLDENPELKAAVLKWLITEEEAPPEMATSILEDEDTFAAAMRLAALGDPLLREMAKPLTELTEIQCRWIRENPDMMPWWDELDPEDTDAPQA